MVAFPRRGSMSVVAAESISNNVDFAAMQLHGASSPQSVHTLSVRSTKLGTQTPPLVRRSSMPMVPTKAVAQSPPPPSPSHMTNDNGVHIVASQNPNRPRLLPRQAHQVNDSNCSLTSAKHSEPHPDSGIHLLRRITPESTSDGYLDDMKAIASDLQQALQRKIAPSPVEDCTGGVYYMRSTMHRIAAIFKPADEEAYAPNNPKQYLRENVTTGNAGIPGIRAGISAGDSATREVAAYLLDKDHRAGVPMTALASAYYPAFHYAAHHKRKPGSLQVYVPHKCLADDLSPNLFPVEDVHKIAVLDIRLGNQDRHGGNVLVTEPRKKTYKLVPIDHGACLPRVSSLSEMSFLWLFWAQAKEPFAPSTLDYITSLNSREDEQLLQQQLPTGHELEPDALLTLHLCTAFLQVCAVERRMSAYEIGMLMCRHGSFHQQESKPSVLEQIAMQSLAALPVFKHQRVLKSAGIHRPCDRQSARGKHWDQYVSKLLVTFRGHMATYFSRMQEVETKRIAS